MFDSTVFDEVSCEEYYDDDWLVWMEELKIDAVNGELQVIQSDFETNQGNDRLRLISY